MLLTRKKRIIVTCATVSMALLLAGIWEPEAGTKASAESSVPGPLAISERMLSSDGQVLRNTPVRLMWDEGGRLSDLRQLSMSKTDGAGAAQIGWTPSKADLAIAAENGNWFNFDVIVGSGSKAGWLTVPRKWTGSNWLADGGQSVATKQPALVFRVSDMTVAPADYARKVAARASTYSAWTKVANVPAARDVRTNFSYGSRADSTIQVKANDGSGWFSAGKSHIANVDSTVHGSVGGPNTIQVSVLIRYTKSTTCAGGWICHTRLAAREWLGGIRSARIHNWSCFHGLRHLIYRYPRTTGITKNSGRNRTYDFAVSVAGVGLSAHSGYSTSVDMHVDFRRRGGINNKRFCVGGSTDYWPQARTIYVSSAGRVN